MADPRTPQTPVASARIAVDMDEVLADTLPAHLGRYNAHFGTSITLDDLHGQWLWQAVPVEHHEQLIAWLNEPEFFGELELIADAVRVLQRLSQHHEVFVASAAMEVPASFSAKFRWMERHFPFIPHANLVFCGDKSILRADYLIDDNPRQLRLFTAGGEGTGMLFTAPHNRATDAAAEGWVRVDGWQAVEDFFFS